jgi:hypothetical protein
MVPAPLPVAVAECGQKQSHNHPDAALAAGMSAVQVLHTEAPSLHIGKFTTDGRWLVSASLAPAQQQRVSPSLMHVPAACMQSKPAHNPAIYPSNMTPLLGV